MRGTCRDSEPQNRASRDQEDARGFFNLSTWLTAIAGSAVLLLAYHLVTSRGNSGRTRRRPGWAHR